MAPTPSVKFYYAPGACSLAPHILLHEISLPYTPIPLRIGAERTSYPESLRAVNPKMRVPTISIYNSNSTTTTITNSTDEVTVTEVPAVCTSISNLSPSIHLMGATPHENVQVLEWLNYLSGTLHSAGFGHLFRPERFSSLTTSDALAGIELQARETITKCFEYVEKKLGDREREGDSHGGNEGKEKLRWAVGNQITAVDAFLLVFWRWGVLNGFLMEGYRAYKALMGRVVERESVREVLTIEGIEGLVKGSGAGL